MERGDKVMSATIDERVVEMRFDNKQFEDGVQTSMSTLERLRKSLNLEGATKGLEAVDEAAKKCKMTPLGDAVDAVKVKFSAMQIVATTAIANITNSAINMGKKLIKSLTVDPISDGFKEYELKMDSVQNIMNGTGESLETVMKYLNELNTYADRTIYSFSDMTSNIGKFTNSGVKLHDAVKAIQGVSNVAAISGANTQQASHAMYNFAQALSSGSVKLIDWKSIETANMATMEFKTELLKTALALGTVKKKGDQYISTTKDQRGKVSAAFDATKNFNESLSSQWMTTEVLVQTLGRYSDETTAIGKKAFAAAQDVKTFSQLMDTLKEAVGSGWSETFELIFGNFEEAKALWTEVSNAVGGVIDKMSKGRNAIFQEWHDLGGRTALIDSIRNSVKAIVAFIKPIKEAFSEIISPITGKKLAAISKNLKAFTENFKMSGRTAKNVKETFKGLFAVFDILGQAVSALFGGVKRLVGIVPVLGDALFRITGSFGKYFVAVDEYIKKNKIFEKVVNTIVDVLFAIPKGIDAVSRKLSGMSFFELLGFVKDNLFDIAQGIVTAIGLITDVDTSGLSRFSSRVGKYLKPVVSVLHNITKDIIGGIKDFTKGIGPTFSGFGTIATDFIGNVGKALSGFISNADFKEVLDLVNSGVLVSIGLGIRKFVNSLTGLSDSVGGTIGSWGDVANGLKSSISGLTECLTTMTRSIKADILKKIATAVGILTVSIVVLASIDSDKLAGALAAITGEFLNLFVAMSAFQRIMARQGSLNTIKAATVITSMANAILVLAIATRILSGMKTADTINALGAIATLSEILIFSAKQLAGIEKLTIRSAASVVVFALAIQILAKSVKQLASIDSEQLLNGLVGLGIVMASIVAFLELADFDGFSIGKAAGLVVFATSILILSKTVKALGSMQLDEMNRGLLGLAAAMGILVLGLRALAIVSDEFGKIKIISISVGLLILSSSLLVLTKSINILGNMNSNNLVQGLNGLAISLGLLVSAFIAMGAAMKKFGEINVMSIAASVLIISTSMLILSKAIGVMGGMSLWELSKGLIAVAAVLGAIVGTFVLISKYSSGSVIGIAFSILVIASALKVLTSVLKALGQMPFWDICKALLAIAGVFAILGKASMVLEAYIPALLGLSGSLILLGIGLAAVGAGLLLIGSGITAVAVSVAASISSLIASIKMIIVGTIMIIPDTIDAIISIIPALANALIIIVKSLCAVIIECTPPIIDAVMVLLVDTLKALAKYTPVIVDYLFIFLLGLIDGLIKYTPQLVSAVFNLIGTLFSAIIDALGSMDSDVLLKAVAGIGFIVAIIYALGAIAPLIPGAMAGVLGVGIIIAEMALVLAAVGALSKIPGLTWLIGEGGNLLQAIGVAIGQFFGGILGGIASGITSQLPKIATNMSQFMINLEPFLDGIRNIDPVSMDMIKALAGAILVMTSASVLDGLTSWFTGGRSFAKFGDELVAFVPKLIEYANAVSGLTPDAVASVKASAEAAKALAEFGKIVPNEGGMAAWFAGENSVSKFGDDMVSFGKSLVAYSNAVKGVDAESVKMSAEAGKALAEFGKNVPNEGGMAAWFAGENSVAKFGEDLVLFGANLKSYSFAVKDVNVEDIQNSVKAAKALSNVAGTLQNHGGAAAWFAGDNKLDEFGASLKVFGDGISTYSVLVNGVNVESVISSAKAAQSLSNMAGSLQEHGGIGRWFTGDNKIDDFGKSLVNFGKSLATYSSSIKSVDASKVQNTAIAAKHFGELDKLVTEPNDAIVNLGNTLPVLGVGIGKFYSSTFNVSPMRLSLLITGINDLISMIKLANGIDSSNLKGLMSAIDYLGSGAFSSFGHGLELFGDSFVKYSTVISEINVGAVTASATAAQSLANLASSLQEHGGIGSWFTGDNKISDFGKNLVEFGESLAKYSTSVVDVDADQIQNTAMAAKHLGELDKSVTKSNRQLDDLGDDLPKLGEGISKFYSQISDITPGNITLLAGDLKDLFDVILSLGSVKGSGFDGLCDVIDIFCNSNFSEFIETLEPFGAALSAYSEKVADLNIEGITASVNAARSLSDLAGTLQNHGGVASWFAGDNTISDFGKNLVDFGKSLSSYSSSVANVDASKVQNTADAAKHLGDLDKSVTQSNGQLADLGRSLPALGEGLGLFYSSTIAVSPMRLSLLASELKSLIDMMKSAKGLSKDSMNGFVKSLKTLGETSISMLVDTFDNAATKVSSAVTRLINAITSAVKEKQTSVNSAFKTLAEGGAKAIKKEWQKFYDAGEYVAKGFCSGVTSSNTGAIRAGTSLARKALEAARRTLDENSPSKEFYKIGAFAGAGFVNALNDSQKDVDRAGSSFGRASIDALSQTIGRIAEAVDDNIDVQPTITPVLDLSEIQNGRKKLNGIIPKSAVLSAGNSYALASGVLTLLAGGVPSAGRGNISIYNTFNEANNRDGMAIIRQLNREMGAMI